MSPCARGPCTQGRITLADRSSQVRKRAAQRVDSSSIRRKREAGGRETSGRRSGDSWRFVQY
eukprot:4451031-Pyramimonas_sp.AAC.1